MRYLSFLFTIFLVFLQLNLIKSITQTCLTNATCPANSYCGSNQYCKCNTNFINYACNIQASPAQSPPNFTILSTTTSYFYIQPPASQINNYLYYVIRICSTSATVYPSTLNLNSYANLGTNDFLSNSPIDILNVTFQQIDDCFTLHSSMLMFSQQPNGQSEQLIIGIVDITSSPTSQNIITIDSQLNQVIQSGLLRIVGYILMGISSIALICGIALYCKRRRQRRARQGQSTQRKTVSLSPQQKIAHFDQYMPAITYQQQLEKNNQIINGQNPILNIQNSQFQDKLKKIQKKAIQMSAINSSKKSQTNHPQNQSGHKYQNKKLECCVCLNQINKMDVIRETICHHIFHKYCIDQWCKKAEGINCPMCRTELDYENVKKLLSQRGQGYESLMSQYINQTSRRFQMKRSLLQ